MFQRHRSKLVAVLSLFSVGYFAATSWALSPPALMDFETHPVEPTGPSLFASAGPEQDITLTGVATASGGVILGEETNLPALAFTTPPNDYGTASPSFIPGTSATLLPTLTVAIDPSYSCDEFSFTLLNGYTATRSYVVTAFDGSSQVAQQTFSITANTDSGFHLYDLISPTITSATITTDSSDGLTGWDFSVDSLSFNQSIQQAVDGQTAPTGVPLPPGVWSAGAMLAILGGFKLLRSRRQNAAT